MTIIVVVPATITPGLYAKVARFLDRFPAQNTARGVDKLFELGLGFFHGHGTNRVLGLVHLDFESGHFIARFLDLLLAFVQDRGQAGKLGLIPFALRALEKGLHGWLPSFTGFWDCTCITNNRTRSTHS